MPLHTFLTNGWILVHLMREISPSFDIIVPQKATPRVVNSQPQRHIGFHRMLHHAHSPVVPYRVVMILCDAALEDVAHVMLFW